MRTALFPNSAGVGMVKHCVLPTSLGSLLFTIIAIVPAASHPAVKLRNLRGQKGKSVAP